MHGCFSSQSCKFSEVQHLVKERILGYLPIRSTGLVQSINSILQLGLAFCRFSSKVLKEVVFYIVPKGLIQQQPEGTLRS